MRFFCKQEMEKRYFLSKKRMILIVNTLLGQPYKITSKNCFSALKINNRNFGKGRRRETVRHNDAPFCRAGANSFFPEWFAITDDLLIFAVLKK